MMAAYLCGAKHIIRKTSGLAIATALTVLQCGTAYSADQNGNFAIRGAGLQTCGNLIEAFDDGTEDLALYAGWIDGYVTGLNQFREDTFDMTPWQTSGTLLAMTTQVCRTEAEDTGFMTAFVSLLRGLSGARLTQQSELTGVFSSGQRVVLYKSTVADLERKLVELGHNVGQVDEEFTENTARALMSFQSNRGLKETGLPDQKTLFALFVSSVIEGASSK